MFTHIAEKRMDEEARKGNKDIGQVTEQEGDTAQGYEPCPDGQLAKEGYDEMQLWSDDMQCYVCGLVPKSQRDGQPIAKRQNFRRK